MLIRRLLFEVHLIVLGTLYKQTNQCIMSPDIILQLINRKLAFKIKTTFWLAAVMHYLVNVFLRQWHPSSDLNKKINAVSHAWRKIRL